MAGLLTALGVLAGGAWLQFRAPTTAAPAQAAQTNQAAPSWPLLDAEALLARPTQGRWLWARWSEWPSALVVQFPSLETQGAALNRIAAWKEKGAAPRERVLDDLALATLIHSSGDSPASFYGGHDYRLTDLATFFALADQQHLPLNPEERQLREALRAQGWLEGAAGTPRVLISFTDLQQDNPRTRHDETVDPQRRRSVLLHELSHARFFLDGAYRRRCQWLWHQALTEAERARIRQQLIAAGYDGGQPELLINETQALLLHTADPRAFQAQSLGLTENRLQALRAQFAR